MTVHHDMGKLMRAKANKAPFKAGQSKIQEKCLQANNPEVSDMAKMTMKQW